MRKVLDIVIAHYNEPFSIVKPAIDMLTNQKCVDFDRFRVTLIHDGTPLFEELENDVFPFEFRELSIQHGGISKVRNYGIDTADAEWITFCDCDDSYSSIYSLFQILSALDDDRFDMLWAPYYVQRVDEKGSPLGIKKEFNLVWIHNKYYRLDFLKEHNVRFNEDLEFLEDGAFNMQFYLETEEGRIGEMNSPYPLYSWCRRKGSSTTNKDNLVKITSNTIERDIIVSGFFKKKGRPTYGLMNGRTITDAYVLLTQKRLEPYPEAIKKMEERIKEFWLDNSSNLMSLTAKQWDFVLGASVHECRESGVLNLQRPKFDDWLKNNIGVERSKDGQAS